MNSLHVGIDITALLYNRGVSRYTSNLVRNIVKQRQVQVSLYGTSLRQQEIFTQFVRELPQPPAATAFRRLPVSWQAQIWQHSSFLPIRSVLPAIGIFHSWDWVQPPDRTLPLVSTIHDLALLKFPETAHPTILSMHQASWKTLKSRNARIIAVSQATKRDIVSFLQIPPERITVIHEALPRETAAVAEKLTEETYQQLAHQLHLTRPFILFVGTREPRKNLIQLIRSWEPLANDIDLIIAGEAGWDETARYSSSPHLRFLGTVSDQELAVLYGEARVFCYPSLDEGFGLPILEAFYHGTPVVTSGRSAMSEVAGNAAELIDPDSPESIREGILTVLNESTLQERARLQRMIIRLHLFSWEKAARETVAVYQAALHELQ